MPQVFSAKMNVVTRASVVGALLLSGLRAVGRSYLHAVFVRNRHGA